MMTIPSTVREVIDRGPLRDDWSSLADYQVPAWYQDGSSVSSCIGVRTACRCSAMSGIPAICTCRQPGVRAPPGGLRMTLEEKVAQLTSIWTGSSPRDPTVAPMQG